MRSPILAPLMLGLAVLGVLACATPGDGSKGDSAPSDKASQAAPSPSLPAGTFGPGVYEVGREIKPGTYVCVTSDGAMAGYWERAKDAGGTLESIIANDNVPAGTQTLVLVKKGEVLKTQRLLCKPR